MGERLLTLRLALWALGAGGRLRSAVRAYWRRILAGAFIGWVYAVVGGAFALATLEFWQVISRSTSDELGIIVVLASTGLGALQAYRWRPA